MARKLRIQYPGAIYHVMNRGDRREPIFKYDRDRTRFVGTLAEACGKTAWQVQAYCLGANHFHLPVETPQGNLAPDIARDPFTIAVYRSDQSILGHRGFQRPGRLAAGVHQYAAGSVHHAARCRAGLSVLPN